MADLILLPTLERLHPHDHTEVTPNLAAFGLTLSAALAKDKKKLSDLGPAKDLGISLLQPWTWKTEADIQETDEGAVEIADVLFFSVGSSLPAPAVTSRRRPVKHEKRRSALEDRLKVRFEAFRELEAEERVTWSWDAQPLKVHRESRPWPGFLGQLTQYPYPLPQALRLSFFVDLDQDLGPSVVCAPILRFRENKTIVEVIPDPPGPPDGDRYLLKYRWPALPAPPEPVRLILEAQTVACATRKDEAPSSAFFDFGSLWINSAPVGAHGTDWRAGLELRVAEQLHFPRTIAKWMSENRDSAGLLPEYSKMVWVALQKLRELLGPGLRKDAPDGAFLKRANFFLGQPASDEEIKNLRAEADAFFILAADGRKRWLGWLREAVSGLKDEKSSGLLDAAMEEKPEEAIGRALSLKQAIAALDQLLASVAEPATLRTFFKLQWSALVKAKYEGSATGEAKLARALASDLPGEIDLERLLLLDHLSEHWETLKQAAFKDSPDVKSAGEKLRAEYRKLLKQVIPKMSDADLDEFSARFRREVLPEKLDTLEPRGTRGLTFQLDTLGQDDQGAKDLLRNMQGVALLMRRKGETEYHCLNMASADVGGENLDLLIPSRLAYVNDLRSPTVTYDNSPLTVAGPLGAGSVAGVELDDGEIEKEIDKPLIEITHSARKIPGLVFGKEYEVLPFLVTNSGVIPADLAETGKPWKIKENLPALTRPAVKKSYPRETHVGALRFLSNDAAGLPPIPERVAPRMREQAPEAVVPAGDPLLDKKDELRTDSVLAGTPLLLLAPSEFPRRSGVGLRDRFQFRIASPTLDLQTWDRWVAGEPEFSADKEKKRRKFVWRSFYQLTDDQGRSTGKLEEAGIYLDDPAVEGIWVELKSLPASEAKNAVWVPFKRKPFPSGIAADFSNWKQAPCTLATEQREPLPFECSIENDTLKVSITPKEGPAQSLTAQGTLFRLSVYAGLKDGAEKKFLDGKEIVRDKDFKGTSPWHLLIEIPQALPQTKALGTALRNTLQPSYAGGVLKVGLDMNSLAGLKGHVYRAELLHQVWSWRGRPPADHPELVTGATLRAFHMSEFGVRGDDEHRRLPLPRSVQASPEPVFHYEEDLSRQGPEGDLRALHHRFSARVFSRWEGLLPEGQGVLEAQDEDTEDRWRPQFVPCRRRKDVPPPKVRMVLPMTEGSPEKKAGGPGLMVVVDGRWYEAGGLAEDLDVEVMTVLAPDADPENPDPKLTYYQIGTDPIETRASIGELLGAGKALAVDQVRKIDFKIEGAIGHHRDHSQTDPFFLASSFLLHRPEITLKGGQKPVEVDLSWCFVKLRFRRALKKVEGIKPDAAGKVPPVVSEWSAPFWVQILPGVERVEEDWLGEGAHEVKLNGMAMNVTGVQQQTPRSGFHLFAVMTRKVIDFAGRPDQEAYLGVWAWNPQTRAWSPEANLNPGTEKDLYVRFLEAQSKKAPGPGALWDAIFKADQKDIDRARIVRISKRFNVNGGPQ